MFCCLIFIFININQSFIQQEHIQLIKSDSKDIYNITLDFRFKLMLFIELSVHLKILITKL